MTTEECKFSCQNKFILINVMYVILYRKNNVLLNEGEKNVRR